MKIDYDPDLYKAIARLQLNEMVQVTNRKGRRSTIHITNITKLSWPDLQQLSISGADRFSKMFALYEKYSRPEIAGGHLANTLTSQETAEINAYINIFWENNFSEHFQVNNFITSNDLWDKFSSIRSLNDHGEFTAIQGIQPKYFEVACHLLKISGGGGRPLDAFTKY